MLDVMLGEIKTAIDNQLKHGRYESSHLVGDGTVGTQIANILATSNLKIQKQISYVSEDLNERIAENTCVIPVREEVKVCP